MKKYILKVVLVAILCTTLVVPAINPANAQTATSTPTIQELRNQIVRLLQIIADLQKRLVALRSSRTTTTYTPSWSSFLGYPSSSGVSSSSVTSGQSSASNFSATNLGFTSNIENAQQSLVAKNVSYSASDIIEENGVFYLVVAGIIDGQKGAHVYISSDKGATWVKKGVSHVGGDFSYLYIKKYGNSLYVIKADQARFSSSIERSTDGGATWRVLQLPAGVSARDIDIVHADNGGVLVAYAGEEWGISLLRSNDNGATWSQPRVIQGSESSEEGSVGFHLPRLQKLGNGKIGLAYYRTIGPGNSKQRGVSYRESSDNGQTWSDRQAPFQGYAGRIFENYVTAAEANLLPQFFRVVTNSLYGPLEFKTGAGEPFITNNIVGYVGPEALDVVVSMSVKKAGSWSSKYIETNDNMIAIPANYDYKQRLAVSPAGKYISVLLHGTVGFPRTMLLESLNNHPLPVKEGPLVLFSTDSGKTWGYKKIDSSMAAISSPPGIYVSDAGDVITFKYAGTTQTVGDFYALRGKLPATSAVPAKGDGEPGCGISAQPIQSNIDSNYGVTYDKVQKVFLSWWGQNDSDGMVNIDCLGGSRPDKGKAFLPNASVFCNMTVTNKQGQSKTCHASYEKIDTSHCTSQIAPAPGMSSVQSCISTRCGSNQLYLFDSQTSCWPKSSIGGQCQADFQCAAGVCTNGKCDAGPNEPWCTIAFSKKLASKGEQVSVSWSSRNDADGKLQFNCGSLGSGAVDASGAASGPVNETTSCTLTAQSGNQSYSCTDRVIVFF